MRITRDLLHKYSQETVKQRKRSEPDLHAAYLTGSLLRDDPLIGGTTDIDIVLVHKYKAPVERETVALTQELSLDIIHKVKDDYDQHRQLRQDPFLGYPLTNYHALLFDTDHWLEFIQASVNAEFHRPANVLFRVNSLLSAAREIWFSLMAPVSQNHLGWLDGYLKSLSLAADTIVGLIGPPLTTRRFMVDFKNQVDLLGVPRMVAGFNGLIGLTGIEEINTKMWINAFEQDLDHLLETATFPIHLSPCRKPYYLAAIRSLFESDNPDEAIWPLLRTWLDILLSLPQPSPNFEIWENCLADLNLTEDFVSQKVEALDAYLDNVDIIIESWGEAYGGP